MKQSPQIRIGLSPAEYARLKRLSDQTGVSIARLTADAVRAVHLKKAA